MKGEIKTDFKNHWREILVCGSFPFLMEVLLHILVYGEVTARMVYPCLFALAGGFVLFFISTLFQERVNRILFLVFTSLITLYFEIQFVYNSIFGEFMAFWQFGFGAEAVANFWQQMFYGIWEALPKILLLLLPQILLFILVIRKKWGVEFQRCRRYVRTSAGAMVVLLHLLTVGLMILNDDSAFSAYRLYQNPNTATEISVKNIGLLSTARLECKYLLFSGGDATTSYYIDGEKVTIDRSEMDQINMMNIDFDALSQETDSQELKNLDEYFAHQEPTKKNEYTGIFKGYNLITICAESFSPYLIDETLTPALYELSTNGFVFNNYYGSFPNNTTNGEYTFCVGLYPDFSRKKSMASFYASQNNYLPFCLGNEFRNLGAETWAYHNYSGEYYSRNVTHPNMGYTFKSAGDGLDMEPGWPTSDLEMMEKSVDDYIDSGKQFCAYYMTFSGHYQYNWDNPISAKNKSAVEDLPYSETVKAYISSNLELEYALEYLMDRLEEAGIADHTVIVLTNDHYPYGLSEEEYNELAGEPVDTTFGKYKNSFICYVPGMSVPVDTYCSTADILPTLLNLFGLTYDSRLLAGKDVLSEDANDYAVLADQSFITADFAFDTSTGSVTYFSDDLDTAQADARIAEIQKEIADAFSASSDMLGSDYYAHALLGKAEEASELQTYSYTDIPDTFSMGALDYICGNQYMDAVSDTEFGFQLTCTYGELLEALYRISGSPEVETAASAAGSTAQTAGKYDTAIAWARENGLLDPSAVPLTSDTPIIRKYISVTLYRYAASKGLDTKVEESQVSAYAKAYPAYTEEEVRAVCWCFDKAILRASGTLDSAFESVGSGMNRNQVAISLYNFYLYVLS